MANKPLTASQLQQEMEKIMNGEDDYNEPYEDSGSDWEEDYLEEDSVHSDSSEEYNQPTNHAIEKKNPELAEERPEEALLSYDQESSDDDEPLASLCRSQGRRDPNIVFPKQINIKGKNGHKWSSKQPVLSKRVSSRNIVHFISGCKGESRNCSSIKDHFLHFFHDNILDIVILHTNEEIVRQSSKYAANSATVSKLCKDELLAFLGILVFSAAKKDNHLNARHMFEGTTSGSFYRACMSRERFTFLVNCLRFDDKTSREERRKTDSFAPICDIWNMLIDVCRSSYIPSSYLTIDEQLLGFRGRCPFRMYIPNKPSKYGIKIIMLCDTSSKYMIDASPYLGKSTDTGGLPLANFYVKELTKSVHGSNRNITMDNWFTSVSLADELLELPYKLTIIGTLRKNKKEIPPELLKNRQRGTSMFCFDRKKTLVSYAPKPNKIVLLLSTLHEGASISENGKPDIIINYNETKSGVDTFDQLCSNMTCSRKTRRWPMCVFYGMINIATINSFVVYCHNSHKANTKPASRFQFMLNLGKSLAEPWMRQRLNIPNLRRNIRQDINEILNIQPVPEPDNPMAKKRTVCSFCPSRLRRMTTNFCVQCKRAICGQHNRNCCPECPFSSA